MSVPKGGDAQQPLNLSEHFAQLSWYDALAGTWVPIAVIRPGKSNLLHSFFARHISVSNRWFTVMNASKAIAGVYKIESEMQKSKCLVFIHLIVTGLRQCTPGTNQPSQSTFSPSSTEKTWKIRNHPACLLTAKQRSDPAPTSGQTPQPEPAPTSAPSSAPASQVALVSIGTAAAEPGSWSSRIAEAVVVPVVGAVMVVALLIWQKKNIARCTH